MTRSTFYIILGLFIIFAPNRFFIWWLKTFRPSYLNAPGKKIYISPFFRVVLKTVLGLGLIFVGYLLK